MVFNSIFFFLTLAPILVIYYFARKKRSAWLKIILLVYSYFFYGMWNVAFLLLLFISSLVDYYVAMMIVKYPSTKRVAIIASLLTNLGVLVFFKYWNFFSQSSGYALRAVGIDISPPLLDIILPVGISFYSFQTLSYTLDVYRGHLKYSDSILDFFLYVSFFPQLVAGPIVRASDFLPQMNTEPQISKKDIADGAWEIIFGLFLKCVIADNVAHKVNRLFSAWEGMSLLDAWSAAGLFGVQIYGDFAGYSLMAIGLARIMGYSLLVNFKAPYGACGFSDFWHRWHISLSTWLRDYLYISLGGSKKGTGRTYVNLITTMFLGGLWHGASVMFVIWGLLHGLFLCIERPFRKFIGDSSRPKLVEAFILVFTFAIVTITWIPFRAQTSEQCLSMMKTMFCGPIASLSQSNVICLGIISCMFFGHVSTRYFDVFAYIRKKEHVRICVMTLLLLSLYFCSGQRSAFIYFQF